MRVLIDADACPVTRLAVALCREAGVPDSVDFALANRVAPGDLVVTQDYGLAAICLARGAAVLDQNGREYTAENIDALLTLRYTAAKLRRAGGRTRGPHKRTAQQDRDFSAKFRARLLTNCTE